MNNDDDEFKDDGSVWTSYSDLFTTVTVIFLVMFVFALIKAGVSQIQTVVGRRAHEAELAGQITKKNKAESKKQIKEVTESLTSIKEYEDLVNNKMREMNKFVKDLQKNKTVMMKLIEDQIRKESMLKGK